MRSLDFYGAYLYKSAGERPLSERDIIDIHNQFLTNGFHIISVPSIKEGRALLHDFFCSMQYYHTIGCITLENNLFDATIAHIYHELLYGGYLDPIQEHDLDEFFIERFYFDFVWIEGQKELLMSNWFAAFEKKIREFSLDKNIPIIVFVCEELL